MEKRKVMSRHTLRCFDSRRILQFILANCRIGFACFILVTVVAGVGVAEDWSTYRFSVTRNGVTPETIGPELFLHGRYVPTHAPVPAWFPPAEELPRMHGDNALHVAVANGNVYFGSSVTNKVCSVEYASGWTNWTFFTEGPVRFAPTVTEGRVYFGSDDGYVYCIDALNGSLIWKYRAGPSDEKVIGNGRIISLWPVRTSVLVDDGKVYFGAGVFPFEGIHICALNADDGAVIWKNDTIGDRAHDLEFGGISPHGYLVASKDTLYVPSGRAMPAAFDRRTGKFLFYASPGGKRGGAWALLDNDKLIAGVDASGTPHKYAYDAKTGSRRGDAFGWYPGIDMVLTRDFSYVLTRDGIYGINRAVYAEAVRKTNESAKERNKLGKQLGELRKKLKDADEKTIGKTNEQIDEITRRVSELAAEERRLRGSSFKWRYSRKGLCSLIMASNVLFAGGEGLVVGVDAQTGKEVWKGDVSGRAVGLAASDGRLFVSSDKGPISCFGEDEVNQPVDIKTGINPNPYPKDDTTALYESAAEKIVKETSVNKGYCLVLDCGRGRLAFELAKRTELQIIGIEKDREKLEFAREKLEAAGLLGTRVAVEPWDISSLPDYFANLVVSDGMLTSGKTAASKKERRRVLRPYGGVSYLSFRRFLSNKIAWRKFVRGKLKGAGNWTQLYGNSQNTACSGDELVKGPLGVLWFGEPGPQRMLDRHARAESPVSMNGRLFIQGEEVVMAYDAYNGTFLWKRDIPGAVRARVDVDGGNLALTEDALYIAAHDKCYRLDPATGETVRVFEMPGSPSTAGLRWGFVSCVENVLFGVTALPLEREYAAAWKDFVDNGKWKERDQITPEIYRRWGGDKSYWERYENYRRRYPVPNEKLRWALQRSGGLWEPINKFPSWDSQRSPKGALTGRLMGGDAVFAKDVDTGTTLWTYRGKRIPNISVAVVDGTVFFVESVPTAGERDDALKEKQQLIEKGIYKEGAESKLKPADADVRIVVALDAVTGETLWKKPLDLTGCGGDKVGTAYADGLLLFFGHFSNHDTGFFKKDELTWRRITALDVKTKQVTWSRPLNYLRRPLVVGDKIIVEPRACNLYTGEIITRSHPITDEQVPWEFLRPGHSCGVTSASADTLFYRSYWPAIYGLTKDRGVSLFGGIRPGCWLNMISANGLMLMPEASSGCTCSFPLRSSFALVNKPRKVTGNWTVFVTHGEMTPVKRLAVNFGAPGDMRDDKGTLWFGYPRPKTVSNIGYGSYEVTFNLQEKVIDGMGLFCRDFKGVHIEKTERPWLFTSGYQGLLRCEVPLIDDVNEQEPGTYTVRLGFTALPGDKRGQRIFDVKLQDSVVLRDFDILKTAGKANKAIVKKFKGVRVKNNLVLELVPKSANLQINSDEAPIINFIEVIRERTRRR
jgi:outer membrane protein assembly factor BamB